MNKRQRRKALKKMRRRPMGEMQFQINGLMNKIIKESKGYDGYQVPSYYWRSWNVKLISS